MALSDDERSRICHTKQRGTELFAKAIGIEVGEYGAPDLKMLGEAIAELFYAAALAANLGNMQPEYFAALALQAYPLATKQVQYMRAAGRLDREEDGHA